MLGVSVGSIEQNRNEERMNNNNKPVNGMHDVLVSHVGENNRKVSEEAVW